MKTGNKILLWCLCIVAVVVISVTGTLAYLTDRDSAVNTFTVGQVDITLDEAKVNTDGTPVKGAERVPEVKGKFIFLTAISYKCFVFTVIHIFFYFRTLIHTA